jgi:hypothetical protein
MGAVMGLTSFPVPAATAVEDVTAVRRVTPPLPDTEGGFRAAWLAAPSCAEIPPAPRCEGVAVFTAAAPPLIGGRAFTGCGRKLSAAMVTAREPTGKRLAAAGGGRPPPPPPRPEVNIAPGARTVPAPPRPVVTSPPHCCCCDTGIWSRTAAPPLLLPPPPLLGAAAGDTGARSVTGNATAGMLLAVVDCWTMWVVAGCCDGGAEPRKPGDIDVATAERGC